VSGSSLAVTRVYTRVKTDQMYRFLMLLTRKNNGKTRISSYVSVIIDVRQTLYANVNLRQMRCEGMKERSPRDINGISTRRKRFISAEENSVRSLFFTDFCKNHRNAGSRQLKSLAGITCTKEDNKKPTDLQLRRTLISMNEFSVRWTVKLRMQGEIRFHGSHAALITYKRRRQCM